MVCLSLICQFVQVVLSLLTIVILESYYQELQTRQPPKRQGLSEENKKSTMNINLVPLIRQQWSLFKSLIVLLRCCTLGCSTVLLKSIKNHLGYDTVGLASMPRYLIESSIKVLLELLGNLARLFRTEDTIHPPY